MKGTAAKMTGNRTGMQTSPELAEELMEGANSAEPSSGGGLEDIAEYKAEYITEGFPVGSMPMMPASEEETADEKESGMAVVLEKLSERLAFERMGTRLYEALYNKCEALGETLPGPTLEEIQEIGSEELEHFILINDTIAGLGGDPTVESPCRSEEHTSELQSRGLISYAVFCLKKNIQDNNEATQQLITFCRSAHAPHLTS